MGATGKRINQLFTLLHAVCCGSQLPGNPSSVHHSSLKMGSCLSGTAHDDIPCQEKVLVNLQEENVALRQEVAALSMELYQQRAEVSRLMYINDEDRRLLNSYKTRYWSLRMGDLLSSRRLEPTRPRGP